jgi:hypothetical protein
MAETVVGARVAPMSRCRIERKLSDVAVTLAQAKREAEKFRSRFDGDVEKGDYTLRTPVGTIEGTYSVTDSTVCFLIEKKPAVVPCGLIERVLDQFLRNNA